MKTLDRVFLIAGLISLSFLIGISVFRDSQQVYDERQKVILEVLSNRDKRHAGVAE